MAITIAEGSPWSIAAGTHQEIANYMSVGSVTPIGLYGFSIITLGSSSILYQKR